MENFLSLLFNNLAEVYGTVPKLSQEPQTPIEIVSAGVELNASLQDFSSVNSFYVPRRTFGVFALGAHVKKRIKVPVNN